MSEKPISSSRVARRKAVGERVTADNDPPVSRLFDAGMTNDYKRRGRCRPPGASESQITESDLRSEISDLRSSTTDVTVEYAENLRARSQI